MMNRAHRFDRSDRSDRLPPACRPIAPLLPALPDDELSPADAAKVQAHLDTCPRCRQEARAFLGLGELLREQSAPPVDLPTGAQAVAWIERSASRPSSASSNGRIIADVAPRPVLTTLFRRLAVVKAAPALLIAGAGLFAWHSLSPTRAAWEIVPLAGAPRVGAARIRQTGHLHVGEWLETDSRSSARLDLADVGQVKIEPNTRLRLLEARPREQRLSLALGTLHARVSAPPRLFFVDTPSATAVDLGCAYTLAVDAAGRSLLRVTAGQVAFARNGRESVVPAGARCETRPGVGPGTPCFEDAPARFRAALEQFDFGHGGPRALDGVLAAARRRDALTLWNLLDRAPPADWNRVYDRLAVLVPPPAAVTRSGIRQHDPAMLARWQVDVEDTWWE
jgi:hypothetical protein